MIYLTPKSPLFFNGAERASLVRRVMSFPLERQEARSMTAAAQISTRWIVQGVSEISTGHRFRPGCPNAAVHGEGGRKDSSQPGASAPDRLPSQRGSLEGARLVPSAARARVCRGLDHHYGESAALAAQRQSSSCTTLPAFFKEVSALWVCSFFQPNRRLIR